MRVGVIQSNYIPWRGYFDFIASVDLFIFHDDLQYTKGDWRNRNKIKTPRGLQWLTVPVHYGCTGQLIGETPIDDAQAWRDKHRNQLRANYQAAPFYHAYAGEFGALLDRPYATLPDLNIALCQWVMTKLDIPTPCRRSSEFQLAGHKTERLIDLLKKVGATAYLSGPAAKAYLDEGQFTANGLRLEYKSYDYAPYPQLGEPFEGAVTVLDLLFNTGPDARQYLRSRAPDVAAN